MNGYLRQKRHEDGGVSLGAVLNRFNNLLNMVYLSAQETEGGGYRIPDKIFEMVQTELDFNPPETDGKTKKKRLEAQKKRYRQRSTYRFWKTMLDNSNCKDDVDAEKMLLHVYYKLDQSHHYGSLTHCRYALETLYLAIDDVYGTKKCVIEQPEWVAKHFMRPSTTKAKKAKATGKKVKGVKAKKGVKSLASQMSNADVPF